MAGFLRCLTLPLSGNQAYIASHVDVAACPLGGLVHLLLPPLLTRPLPLGAEVGAIDGTVPDPGPGIVNLEWEKRDSIAG